MHLGDRIVLVGFGAFSQFTAGCFRSKKSRDSKKRKKMCGTRWHGVGMAWVSTAQRIRRPADAADVAFTDTVAHCYENRRYADVGAR